MAYTPSVQESAGGSSAHLALPSVDQVCLLHLSMSRDRNHLPRLRQAPPSILPFLTKIPSLSLKISNANDHHHDSGLVDDGDNVKTREDTAEDSSDQPAGSR